MGAGVADGAEEGGGGQADGAADEPPDAEGSGHPRRAVEPEAVVSGTMPARPEDAFAFGQELAQAPPAAQAQRRGVVAQGGAGAGQGDHAPPRRVEVAQEEPQAAGGRSLFAQQAQGDGGVDFDVGGRGEIHRWGR